MAGGAGRRRNGRVARECDMLCRGFGSGVSHLRLPHRQGWRRGTWRNADRHM